MRERSVRLPVGPSSERRASTRYPLPLDLDYAVIRRRRVLRAGHGHILDISSSGLRFTTEGSLDPGHQIEVSIRWPARLPGGVELQMKAAGTIVWTKGNEAAVRLERHEFKTTGRR